MAITTHGLQTFNTAFPFEVKIKNAFQGSEQSIIYITDKVDTTSKAQTVAFSFSQVDNATYTLKGVPNNEPGIVMPGGLGGLADTTGSAASGLEPDQYNIAFVFRPGTLRKKVRNALGETITNAWNAQHPDHPCAVTGPVQRPSDGALVWYLFFVNDIVTSSNWELSLQLTGICAAAGTGTRSTQVEVLFNNVYLNGAGQPLQFKRSLNVDIINHEGSGYAPIYFGILGNNSLLNVKSKHTSGARHSNSFKLYMESIGNQEVAFGPETEFIFSFPYDNSDPKSMHFGNSSQVGSYTMSIPEPSSGHPWCKTTGVAEAPEGPTNAGGGKAGGSGKNANSGLMELKARVELHNYTYHEYRQKRKNDKQLAKSFLSAYKAKFGKPQKIIEALSNFNTNAPICAQSIGGWSPTAGIFKYFTEKITVNGEQVEFGAQVIDGNCEQYLFLCDESIEDQISAYRHYGKDVTSFERLFFARFGELNSAFSQYSIIYGTNSDSPLKHSHYNGTGSAWATTGFVAFIKDNYLDLMQNLMSYKSGEGLGSYHLFTPYEYRDKHGKKRKCAPPCGALIDYFYAMYEIHKAVKKATNDKVSVTTSNLNSFGFLQSFSPAKWANAITTLKGDGLSLSSAGSPPPDRIGSWKTCSSSKNKSAFTAFTSWVEANFSHPKILPDGVFPCEDIYNYLWCLYRASVNKGKMKENDQPVTSVEASSQEFDFSDIQVSGDDGEVTLVITVRNIPNYWDTSFQLRFVKAKSQLTQDLTIPEGYVTLGRPKKSEISRSPGSLTASGPISGANIKGKTINGATIDQNSFNGVTLSSEEVKLTGKVSAGSIKTTGKISAETVITSGDITSSGTVSDQYGPVIPVGTVMAYVGATAPRGWLLCNGQSVSKSEYPILYDLLKETRGHPDTPDLGGRTIIGAGAGHNTTTRNLNDYQDKPNEKISLKLENLPQHTHQANRQAASGGSSSNSWLFSGTTGNVDTTSKNETGGVTGLTGDTDADGAPFSIMPPYWALNFIIKHD